MELALVFAHRFYTRADGSIYSRTHYNYRLYEQRYLQVFDQVNILARVHQDQMTESREEFSLGPGVNVMSLGDWNGPLEFARKRSAIQERLERHLQQDSAVILVVPSLLTAPAYRKLVKARRPYAVEVISDPYDVFAPGSVQHPLRHLIRWFSTWQLKRQCAAACAAAYVTEHAIQQRFPPAPGAYSTHYSSIELQEEAFVGEPRPAEAFSGPCSLITVGMMNQLYKAQDVLIDAVGMCVAEGLDLTLTFVGDGTHRQELEARAAAAHLGDRVRFLGLLPAGAAIREQLDRADVFVLPSRGEGLPRAMIEAMARALPCIGSTASGIPELIALEDCAQPGNVASLAAKIREVVTDPQRMARMSERNLKKAEDYQDHILKQRRLAFYQYVHARTEDWLQGKPQPGHVGAY
jgi:glycosyltransferase involved in cell wall biosynthesis